MIFMCFDFHQIKSKKQEHPTTMRKNPTLFSSAIAGPAKSNLTKHAQVFLCLVIAKSDFIRISLYLAPK